MKTVYSSLVHEKPLPVPDPDSKAYWEALKQGYLLLQHCAGCGHIQVYHQALCRACGGGHFECRPACGFGTVHSYSVVHRAPGPAFRDETPYAVLLVELDEGPRLISSLTGADPQVATFGLRVRLVCDAVTDEISLPRFAPADSARGIAE